MQFDLGIPGVTEEMLESSFWMERIPFPDRIIMTSDEIERYNRKSLRECETLKDLRTYRLILSGTKVREMIEKVSARPSKKRYFDGAEVTDSYFETLEKNLNLDSLPEKGAAEGKRSSKDSKNFESDSQKMVRFGMTVRRTEMRTFPSRDRIFSEPADYEFDQFMETALYPVEPLAIIHESSDGKWYFAQAYNYLAWVPSSDVALTDRKTIRQFLETKDFLAVTGKRVFTGFNPVEPEISELQLDMGVKIPLAARDEIPMEINGQHPAGNYVIKLPLRNSQGNLEWRLGLISRAEEVHVGYLPLTRRNIVTQAFKFLGQRYGWGGMFNTRDCSAFIMDNFRSMGIMLPRNAGEQGTQALGTKHEMPEEMSLDERKKLFDRLPPATPIYMSGHAMLYLYKYADDYYIIHDFAGFSVVDQTGKLKPSKIRGVLVTPLISIFLSKGKKYIEGLYSAREFTLK